MREPDGPEAGEGVPVRSKADKLVPIFLVVGILMVCFDVVWAFTVAPLVRGAQLDGSAVIVGQVVSTKLLLSQKIFYLHVPVAIASFAALIYAAYLGIRFLATKRRPFDVRSRTAMQVTLVLVLGTMISGDLWTAFEWNTWWVWEPRLTTYFILMLMVIAYFILRAAIEDEERRARYAAVFAVVASIDAPISFMVTRLVPSSVHPVVFRTDSGLPPKMLIPFLVGMLGMLLVAWALYRFALHVNEQADEVELLKERLEEADGRAQREAADDALKRLRAQAEAVSGGSEGASGA